MIIPPSRPCWPAHRGSPQEYRLQPADPIDSCRVQRSIDSQSGSRPSSTELDQSLADSSRPGAGAIPFSSGRARAGFGGGRFDQQGNCDHAATQRQDSQELPLQHVPKTAYLTTRTSCHLLRQTSGLILGTEGGSVSQAGRSGVFREPILPVLRVSCSYAVGHHASGHL
jgi:hypothetical protein